MKKRVLFKMCAGIVLVTLLLTITAGCGESQNNGQATGVPPQETKQPTSSPEVKVPDPSASPTQETTQEKAVTSQITKSGGLGDTYQAFEQLYGQNAGDKEMARFNNDYILPMFLNDRAWNVLYQFESTDKPRRSKTETLQALQGTIPADSKKIKEWKVDSEKEIIMYQSDSLAKIFDKKQFDEEKPGTFIAILHKGAEGYFSFTIATGNNP